MELITKDAVDGLGNSTLSINADETPVRRGSKNGSAFRRASAVLGRLFSSNTQAGDNHFDSQQNLKDDQSVKPKFSVGLSKILSGFYCKTLVILGLVLPVTEVLSEKLNPSVYQVYYTYLCSGSILFMVWMYSSVVKNRTIINIINTYRKENDGIVDYQPRGPLNRYGSFYLRLGAIGFGVGSMVYSGLEFGQVLELKDDNDCRVWIALTTPIFRMVLTIGQMQFIFLNSHNVDMCSNAVVSKFGLMHMIATNICEWLNVIIQETKHEITHFRRTHHNYSVLHENSSWTSVQCKRTNVLGSLVEDAAPVLYPCTIEYSLICAVIMYQMWQDIDRHGRMFRSRKIPVITVRDTNGKTASSSAEILILDCANSDKGLVAGIVIMLITLVSLTYYLLSNGSNYLQGAEVIDILELILHLLSLIILITTISKLWKNSNVIKRGVMCLDTWLIMVAQGGVSLYCMFRMIAIFISSEKNLINEIIRLIQTLLQTLFIVHYWRIRANKNGKSARQLITFLILSNAALWAINILVRNKISSDEEFLNFYGTWAWTAISRITMPLYIFYRFHSTICLFEIWKNAFKTVSRNKSSILTQVEAASEL